MDDFLIPVNESAQVIRDNDLIWYSTVAATHATLFDQLLTLIAALKLSKMTLKILPWC